MKHRKKGEIMANKNRRTVVITGGAGGLGFAIAQRFAAGGHNIAIVDYDAVQGEQAAKELRGEGEIAFFQFDVTRLSECENLMKRIYEHFGSVDVLVNNAGISTHRGTTETITEKDWNKILGVNLSGLFFMARAAAIYMQKSGGGAIVNTASLRAYLATGDRTIYAVTKKAILSINAELAADYWRYGIRVNSVSPGYVLTEMTKIHLQEEGWLDNQLNIILADRMTMPEDIAEVVGFLASEDAIAINGSDIPCEGGLIACRGKPYESGV
jgi:NAD(P)-dependent dehydrogenase (short-subunit alcohol dehydrogenase family)